MPEMWGKMIICMETKTYVGESYVERRGQYEVERCDIEMLLWVILI